jgi:hypothetical protein
MGQAFDKTGAFLGEAQADSMREVLEKLERAHPDAAEVRITRNANEKARALYAEIDRRQEAAFIAQDRMLQFFVYGHLPPHLQEISRPFRDLAANIVNTLPSNPERTVALRKLLEAKDCAVRALLYKQQQIMFDEAQDATK